jgi:hypothetical protein
MTFKRNLAFSTIEKKCEIWRKSENSSTKDRNILSLFFENFFNKFAPNIGCYASAIVKTLKNDSVLNENFRQDPSHFGKNARRKFSFQLYVPPVFTI